jgi:hypothetical protein
MQQVEVTIPYAESRNRGTVAVRLILAIPHMLLTGIWQYAVQIASVVQWFIILFTGKRNEGIWNFTNRWLAYASRTYNYLGLMFDEYPGFIDDQGKTPVVYSSAYSSEANRLTNALRLFWAIPAVIIMMLLATAGYVLTIICWFAIVITGSMPRGMFDFLLKAHRYAIQANAYTTLMTDTYPKYGDAPAGLVTTA